MSNYHSLFLFFVFFFLHDPPPTEIYTLSLHDALPIYQAERPARPHARAIIRPADDRHEQRPVHVPRAPVRGVARDRKSTRLNSSHTVISYAVFCLKKKKKQIKRHDKRSLYNRGSSD